MIWWYVIIGILALVGLFLVWHAFAIFGEDGEPKKDFWKDLEDDEDVQR